MSRSVLDQREISTALKRQSNETGSHSMRRHGNPDGLRALLDDTLNLVGVKRPFLRMIPLAKTHKQRRFWCGTRPASRFQIVINRLPDFDREFGKAPFMAFAMPNNSDMIALLHHQIAKRQRDHFRTTNARAQKKHEEGIISFANGVAAIDGVKERFRFLSFQSSVRALVVTPFEAANALDRIACEQATLHSLVQQSPGDCPHA